MKYLRFYLPTECYRCFPLLFFATLICSCEEARDAQPTMRPNIVYINVDDLGYKDLGITGSKSYVTPNIDQLAQSGMFFTQAYSSAANCAPSRACLMTGLQTTRHGIYTVGTSERGKSKDRKIIPIENTVTLADSFVTLAEMLSDEAYHCINIGKWHLTQDPLAQGFAQNIAGTHSGHPPTYFSPYRIKTLEDGPEGEYLTDRITEEAVNFIQQNQDTTFFLYLPFFTVHTPLMGKDEMVQAFESKDMAPGQDNPVYASMIASLDEGVGRVLEALETLGLRENTLIIFTSDNGGICRVSSQAPFRAGKGSYYEGGIRVPFFVSWPQKIAEQSVCNVPISNLDVFPTIKEIARSQIKTTHPLDGASLWSILQGVEQNMEERMMVWHFPIYLQKYAGVADDARDSLFRTRPGTCIRMGEWKLHEYFEDGGLELYNLGMDPGERKNLASQYPDVTSELHTRMIRWREEMDAPVPTALNPEYVELE